MRTKLIVTIIAVAFLPIAGLIQAQPNPPNPPNPPVPPAPPLPHQHDGPDRRDRGPKVPMIFLGVETSPVPSVVSDQLGLPKGFGLVVDYVVPDSPAAAAGLQQCDIIKMLNEQILMEPSQLRKLLQSFADGTAVTLTILRKSQEQKITVKLTKKEVPKRNAFMSGHDGDWDFNFNSDVGHVDLSDLKERLQDMKERLREQAVQRRDMIHETVVKAHEAAARARESARREAGKVEITNTGENGLQTTKIDIGKAQIVFSDEKGELRIEKLDGKKILTAKDPKGLLLFSGPVETKEELDKVPAEVRQRYDKLQERDLPSAISANESGENEDEDSADMESEEEDTDISAEQVCNPPQVFPRNLLTLHTILI